MKKQYKVAMPTLIFIYFVTSIFGIMAIFLFLSVVFNSEQPQGGRWFAAIWGIGVFVFVLPNGLRLPHTLVLNQSGILTFKPLLSESSMDVRNLLAIKTRFIDTTFLYFKFENKSIRTLHNVNGLSELINDIKAINPNIETRGC